jgi:hypothetical protein
MGRSMESLLHSVSTSLRSLLSPLVHQLTKMMCSNYSLEPIAAIQALQQDPAQQGKGPSAADLSELVRLIFSMVELPSIKEIVNV